jgi:hypothetical protein
MCLHATDEEIGNGSQWTAEIKDKEAIIRMSLADYGVMIAPPCRIYPTIALDDSVIEAVKDKADQAFKQVRTEYKQHGYAR